MKWFVKGDFDGFFGLGLNNFINFLLIINLSLFVLGFDVEFVAKRILPAMAVGILIGNFFYGWQARRLGIQLGRDDVTALPYGINLLTIFFFVFYVMVPAQQIALSHGLSKQDADIIAWKAGIIACLGSGIRCCLLLLSAAEREGVEPLRPRPWSQVRPTPFNLDSGTAAAVWIPDTHS